MNIDIYILGSGGECNLTPSLLVVCNEKRYLFNSGEQTLRFANEQSLRIKHGMQDIFYTSMHPHRTGGAIDIIIETQLSPTRLWGPRKLFYFIMASELYRPTLTLSIQELEPSDTGTTLTQKNDLLKVIPIVLNHPGPEKKKLPYFKIDKLIPNYCRYRKNKKIYQKNYQVNDIVCYAAHAPDVIGVFDIKKARELGIPEGPLYSKLKKGESVTLSTGETIQASQIVSFPTPGPAFLVIECPSFDYLDGLSKNPVIKKYMKDGIHSEILKFIFHITPQRIVQQGEENALYQQFISCFSSNVKHIYLNENCPYNEVLPGSSLFQQRLNQIAPDFILLNHINRIHCEDIDLTDHNNHFRAKNMMRCILLPLSRSGTIDLSKHLHTVDITQNKNKMEEDKTLQNLLSNTPSLKEESKFFDYEDQIIFFGTSGAASSKYRGESGILILRPQFGAFLLDAGEGTLASMKRLFGLRKTNQILKDIRVIFISHKHPDHMRGIVQILSERREVLKLPNSKLKDHHNCNEICKTCGGVLAHPISHKRHMIIHDVNLLALIFQSDINNSKLGVLTRSAFEKIDYKNQNLEMLDHSPEHSLTVIGPVWCETFLYEHNFSQNLAYVFCNADLFRSKDHSLKSFFQQKLGLQIQIIEVIHSFPAYGIVIESIEKNEKNSWKIVYSGDTRPCQELIEAGMGCDVLIHESNHEDSMQEKAITDRHSTITEAVNVGIKMKAKNTILTHFSCRWEYHVPDLLGISEQEKKNVAFAFDFLRLTPSNWNFYSAFTPAFQHFLNQPSLREYFGKKKENKKNNINKSKNKNKNKNKNDNSKNNNNNNNSTELKKGKLIEKIDLNKN